MPVNKPFHRICRPFIDGSYSNSGQSEYINHPKYALSPEHYIRSFKIILDDLKMLFNYVEPCDTNLSCYSFKIHELLLRSCIEVEANCKAILFENGFVKKSDWNMGDYRKLEKSHHLSSYFVKLPLWKGEKNVRQPFHSWKIDDKSLTWYQTYNQTKHNRHNAFCEAKFDHMLDSICGLLVLLSSQFYRNDFSPSDTLLSCGGPNDDFESAIGDYFRIKFPYDWDDDMKYNFNCEKLLNESNPFESYNYND